MSKDLESFKTFMQDRESAALAYVNGDAGPIHDLCAKSDPASFYHPGGEILTGAEAVTSRYARDAQNFEPGSDNRLEILHLAASDGLAYWVGIQKARARLQGKPEPVPMSLRITEIFRRDGETWKLIHRHADLLKAQAE